MSRGQKPDPKPMNESLATLKQPSAGEAALTSEATGLMDWIKAGDYRKRPKNLFFNYADPAERDRTRRTQMNAGGQGVYALGAPDPNLLASQKQNLDDEWARDTAGQYEQDVSQAGIRAAGELGDVAQLANTRNLGVLSATSNTYNQQVQQRNAQPRWWEVLIDTSRRGAQAAGGAMASGGGGG